MHLYMYLSCIPTQNKFILVNDKFCEVVERPGKSLSQELAEKRRP